MNSLSAFIVLGLILLLMPMIISPVANTSSAISDTSCTAGFGCFFFGNLGFFMIFLLLATIAWWFFVS